MKRTIQIFSGFAVLAIVFATSLPIFAQSSGAFDRFDRNKDGKVTRNELPNPKTFDRFDVNKDASITLDEYNKVAGVTPGKAEPAGKTPSPIDWFHQTDRPVKATTGRGRNRAGCPCEAQWNQGQSRLHRPSAART